MAMILSQRIPVSSSHMYGPRQPGDNLEPFRQYVYKNYHLAMAYPSGTDLGTKL